MKIKLKMIKKIGDTTIDVFSNQNLLEFTDRYL